jgi:hypothetical protein
MKDETRTVEQIKAPTVKQWHGNQVSMATDTHRTEKLLDVVSSVQFVLRLYSEGK